MAELCRRIPNQKDIIHQTVLSQNVANLLNVTSRRCLFLHFSVFVFGYTLVSVCLLKQFIYSVDV